MMIAPPYKTSRSKLYKISSTRTLHVIVRNVIKKSKINFSKCYRTTVVHYELHRERTVACVRIPTTKNTSGR